jgi:phage I-like protein
MIEKRGAKWVLLTIDDKEIISEHKTYEEPLAQERAIQVQQKKGYRMQAVLFQFDAPLAQPLTSNAIPSGEIEGEIQLLRTGNFYRQDLGHFKITRNTLEKMVANAQERGVDLPVNYLHLGADPNARKEDREAAGWVPAMSLTIRGYKGGHGLFGRVRWTAQAAQKIAEKKLKYISPEIVWSDVRMAASPNGPAGAPIGPQLVGAGLVNDPFFNLDPVTLSRHNRATLFSIMPHERVNYMLSDNSKAEITDLLIKSGIGKDSVEGVLAQIQVKIMEDYKTSEKIETMPEAAPMTEAEMQMGEEKKDEYGKIIAAQREAMKTLNAKVAELEARDQKRVSEETQALFVRYKGEGRFRIFARANEDPTGEKKAGEILKQGLSIFRNVFDSVDPLTGQKPPVVNGDLPTVADAGNSDAANDREIRKYMADHKCDYGDAARAVTNQRRAAFRRSNS